MVLDAEVVAVDRAAPGGAPGGGTLLKSFQELSTRARGTVAAEQACLVLLCHPRRSLACLLPVSIGLLFMLCYSCCSLS